jgi:hypothetical protein
VPHGRDDGVGYSLTRAANGEEYSVVSGVIAAAAAFLLFVITQSILRFIIEPIQEQRKLIGDVAHALLFYANVYHHLGAFGPPDEARREELDEARKALRGLAGRLRASLWTVPFYNTLAWLGRVPKREDVLEAATQLVGWSNSLYGRGNDELGKRQTIIAERLGISKKLGEH